MATDSNYLNILMLGWEYPPHISGGLGKASFGLVKALSKMAHITLFVPRFENAADFDLENVKVYGLNRFGIDTEVEREKIEEQYKEYTQKVEFIDIELSPYPEIGLLFKKEKPLTQPEAIRALYSTREPYGLNIMQKVSTYTEAVVSLAKDIEFDIIHAHDWMTYPAALRLKEITGKPVVAHLHSLETDRVGQNIQSGAFLVEQEMMMKADRVVPVSHYTMQCAIEHYGVSGKNFYPIHNSVEDMAPYKAEKKSDYPLVVFFGRMTKQKGPEFMLETAFKVLEINKKVKFVLAGIGDKLGMLEDKVRRKGYSSNFIFTGFLGRDELREVLSLADIYLMTSVSEPFGLATLEALQFDIPVIISKQSGVSEVLPHVLKANYWETDRFANYVHALINYRGLRKELALKNKRPKKFDEWLKPACEVMALYYSLI